MVFFNIPVASPASEVPFIFTTVKAVDPVASPVWVALVTKLEYCVLVALSPVFVPVRFATAAFANMAFVIAPLAIEVALPMLVTVPVRFAFVVTVAAFPVTFVIVVFVTAVTNPLALTVNTGTCVALPNEPTLLSW